MNKKTRREFLAGITALGAGTWMHGCASTDNAPAAAGTKPHRIDVHHHFVSPGFSAALKQRGQGHAKWSVQMSLDDMDKSGIQTSLLSLIQPAIAIGDVALDRKSTRLNSSHSQISYAVFCLKKKIMRHCEFTRGTGDNGITILDVLGEADQLTERERERVT